MTTTPVTTKTSNQIAADFAAVFKDVKPIPRPKKVTQAERLAPYKPHIMKQRRRGLNWKQIADGMADPRIGENVTERLLKRLFGGRRGAPKARMKAHPPSVAKSLPAAAPQPAASPGSSVES